MKKKTSEAFLELVTEHDDSGLTHEKEAAARLLVSLRGDARAVEAILGLKAGVIEEWLADDESFYERVDEIVDDLGDSTPDDYDFTRVLTPKMLEAAHLLEEESLTQVAAASRVGVTPRTLRDWNHIPAYRLYREQLRREKCERLTEEHASHDLEVRRRLDEKELAAVDVVGQALDDSHEGVALALLRRFLMNG